MSIFNNISFKTTMEEMEAAGGQNPSRGGRNRRGPGALPGAQKRGSVMGAKRASVVGSISELEAGGGADRCGPPLT